MADRDDDDTRIYKAVINGEEQYSIAFQWQPLAPGWREAGKEGTKAEVLKWIGEVWTDMRPLSVRRAMAEHEERRRAGLIVESSPAEMDDVPPLAERLASGSHPVLLRRCRSAEQLREQIDHGYVLVTFTGTRGGTELGARLSSGDCLVGDADFTEGSGRVHLVGDLTLDAVPVRLIADVELETMSGVGHLELGTPVATAPSSENGR